VTGIIFSHFERSVKYRPIYSFGNPQLSGK